MDFGYITKRKTGNGRPKTARTTHACCSVVSLHVQRSQLFALFWRTTTSFEPRCRSSDSPESMHMSKFTILILYINFTELNFHFFSKFGNVGT